MENNIIINGNSFDNSSFKSHSSRVGNFLPGLKSLKGECEEKLSELTKLKRAALRNYNNAKEEYERLQSSIAAAEARAAAAAQAQQREAAQQMVNSTVVNRGRLYLKDR